MLTSEELNLVIKDEISGIAGYEAYIDGIWQLFEYDAKNDLLSHDLGLSNLTPGQHSLELMLRDEVGNESRYKYRFTLP
jgi:hypothetical protein